MVNVERPVTDESIPQDETREQVIQTASDELNLLGYEIDHEEFSAVFPDFEVDQVDGGEALETLEANSRKVEEMKVTEKMVNFLREMRSERVSLKDSLAALRIEFKDNIDKETDAVLAQYEALFSPDLIPDVKERKAVESLFHAEGVSSFTPAVFSGFLDTIYEQSDEVISEETKERIRERFKKPKQRIETADELRREAFRKNDNGAFEYDSPENALALENGMSAYAHSNGQMAVTFESPGQSEVEWIYVKIHKTWVSERIARILNYTAVHREIYKSFDGLTGLFGGKKVGPAWPRERREEAMDKTERFVRCFIGPAMEPHQMLQVEHMHVLRSSLKTLVNPLNASASENLNDLRELGVLNGNHFNWSRLGIVGDILRENRYFRAQAIKNPTLPHQLLKEELAKRDQKSYPENLRPTGLTSATGQSGGR